MCNIDYNLHKLSAYCWPFLSRDGNLHSSGMSHSTTASPKPSFKAPWRVGDSVVGRGNAGWTSRADIPAHTRTAHKGLLQKRLEEDLCWIVPHVPTTTHQSVKGLNWTELNCWPTVVMAFWCACALLTTVCATDHNKLCIADHSLYICTTDYSVLVYYWPQFVYWRWQQCTCALLANVRSCCWLMCV